MWRSTGILQQQRFSVINVITLLSPSPTASRQWLEHVRHWTQPNATAALLEHVKTSKATLNDQNDLSTNEYDALDELLLKNSFYKMVPSQLRHSWFPPRLDSVAMWVGGGGGSDANHRLDRDTLIHCISSTSNAPVVMQPTDSMDLLAIQTIAIPRGEGEDSNTIVDDDKVLPIIRDRLAAKISQSLSSDSVSPNQWMEKIQTWFYDLSLRRSSIQKQLPNVHERLPILDLQESMTQLDTSTNDVFYHVDPPELPTLPRWEIGALKEIVIPTYWSDTYKHNNETLFSTLSNAHQLHRPVTGLYQISPFSQLCIRPLPMAQEDRRVLTPTLVFHTDNGNLDQLQRQNTDIVKIGYTGQNRKGQLMIPKLLSNGNALYVRLCSAENRSSMFAEAQDSLLASSISELQSQDVLASSRAPDPRTNQTDCWVEFRANLRHPLGFVPGFKSTSTLKVARAPDLPYE